MSKFFLTIMEIINWFLIVLSPTLLSILLSAILYSIIDNSHFFYLIIVGVIIGIIFAEKIRRTKGCTTFMGEILRTPDIGTKVPPIDQKENKEEDEKN